MSARCATCPRHCTLEEGQVGFCHARRNEGGTVVCANYGRVTSLALDPVEKKPFSRWMGGGYLLSIGSYGCNLRCPFCQNHGISQAGEADLPWREVAPEQLVDQALGLRAAGCVGIAYTYNEPLVGWEFVRDTARLAHDVGLLNAVVTNGAVEPKAFAQVLPLVDAANIDLKAFNEAFYDACGMHDALRCVKANIEAAARCATCHLEVTTLFVPGMSARKDVLAAGEWLAGIDRTIPYHISQYHPAFQMDERPVPDAELRALVQELKCMLDTVVPGNMW